MSTTLTPNWLLNSQDPAIIDRAGLDGNTLTIWHRQPTAELISAVNSLPHRSLLNDRWSGPLHGFVPWSQQQFATLPQEEREAMALILADAFQLAQWFDRRCAADSYTFRWHRLSDTMCPRFHTDRGPMRLLCTYRGPGTEWAPEDAVDHRALKTRGTENHEIVPDASRVQTIPLFAGAVLCGCDERDRGGVVHRSPSIPTGTSRFTFCMTVD